MKRARRWACAGAGPMSSGFGPKGHGTHNAPHFLRLEDYVLLVGENYSVLGPKVWRIVDY